MAKATTSKTNLEKKSKVRQAPKPSSALSTSSATGSMPEAPPTAMTADRERMIQYAAYHLAEKDGFKPGKEQEYWLQAERQIDELFKGKPSVTAEIH